MQSFVYFFGSLIEFIVDLGQLAFIFDDKFLSLRLALLQMNIPIFLKLLKDSAYRGFFLLPKRTDANSNCLFIGLLLFPDLLNSYFVDLVSDFLSFFVLLQFD